MDPRVEVPVTHKRKAMHPASEAQVTRAGFQSMFWGHRTLVLQYNQLGPPNRMLEGVLTQLQFPHHPNQENCSPHQDSIPHADANVAAAYERLEFGDRTCPHTRADGWEVLPCDLHQVTRSDVGYRRLGPLPPNNGRGLNGEFWVCK